MTRPFILITNDDGIHAAGIRHLWDAVHSFADLAIVAPHTDKSGSGLAITFTKPLQIHEVSWEAPTLAWSVNGTPADCIKMALSILLPKHPDLILSGVNRGSNAGRSVLYSGTVGGVIEGALRNIPGIAFSFCDFEFPTVGVVQQHLASIIQYFLNSPPPAGSFLNVTFPHLSQGIKGFRMARQGRGYWIENPDRRIHPEGIPYYWLGGQWAQHEEEPDSDIALLKAGYLTAVPIHVGEWTDKQLLDQHRDSFIAIEKKEFSP